MTVKKYRKKPVIIDAIQWDATRECWEQIQKMNTDNRRIIWHSMRDSFIIETLEGEMKANKGDWVIKGISGELYPCKPDIFDMTYEEEIKKVAVERVIKLDIDERTFQPTITIPLEVIKK